MTPRRRRPQTAPDRNVGRCRAGRIRREVRVDELRVAHRLVERRRLTASSGVWRGRGKSTLICAIVRAG